MALENDKVAEDVLADPDALKGAVMFKGWLLKVPDATPDRLRLFTDPQFLEWLEIPVSDILHQIPGSDKLNAEGSSLIWVKREARIAKCQSGCAYWFHRSVADMDDDSMARDPTARSGDDLRWPRYPR